MNLDKLEQYYRDGWLIKSKHPTLPLTIWNYSISTQYEGHWDETTLACRGLVTDDKGNIIARPFKKFFNMEEAKHKATADFEVYDKMDGSLIIMFKYYDELVVASRGSFTSDHAIMATKIFKKLNTSYWLVEGMTYLFELIGPTFRIVVDYPEDKLILLGIIRTKSGNEWAYKAIKRLAGVMGVDVVKAYDGIKDFKKLKAMVADDAEGYVVKFSNGDRMKVKGEEYIRLHRIMTEISTKRVWEVLSEGKSMDIILDNVPDEFYDKIKAYENELNDLFINTFATIVNEYGDINIELGEVSDREFALHVKDMENKSFYFSLRNERNIDSAIWRKIRPEFKKL